MDKLEISEMIEQESNLRKKDILKHLRRLNKDSFLFMGKVDYRTQPWKKERYNLLQKEDCWKEAKILLKEYFTLEGEFNCDHCNIPLDRWVMHHETYNKCNLHTPLFIEKLCYSCHKKFHGK